MAQPIVVLAEARNGKLKKQSLEALAAARDLAAQAGGDVVAIVAGHGLGDAAQALALAGATRAIALDSPALAKYSGDGFAAAILPELQTLAPAAVLAPHTAMGKDYVPQLSAQLDTVLHSDVTALHFENGRFGSTKPVYAGKAMLKAFAQRKPFCATLRPNAFEAKGAGAQGKVETRTPALDAASFRSVVTELLAAATDRVPLQEARVVVAGGRGLKAPEQFKLIEDLAAAFGPGVAAVGASRAVVDAGWRPHREQVGQTGKVVAPTLYIAVGISGAIQHLAGMRTSRCVVAINKDPEAPILKIADYGLVGDAFEILPALTQAIRAAAAH
jgi:electron transfer flavoprotein alpha subunit